METVLRITTDLGLEQGVGRSSGKAWQKHHYVGETIEQYPKKIKFSFFGDAADKYHLSVGECYSVHIDIDSREFNGRWYTDVTAWRADEPQTQPQTPAPVQQPTPAPSSAPVQNTDTYLPF